MATTITSTSKSPAQIAVTQPASTWPQASCALVACVLLGVAAALASAQQRTASLASLGAAAAALTVAVSLKSTVPAGDGGGDGGGGKTLTKYEWSWPGAWIALMAGVLVVCGFAMPCVPQRWLAIATTTLGIVLVAAATSLTRPGQDNDNDIELKLTSSLFAYGSIVIAAILLSRIEWTHYDWRRAETFYWPSLAPLIVAGSVYAGGAAALAGNVAAQPKSVTF